MQRNVCTAARIAYPARVATARALSTTASAPSPAPSTGPSTSTPPSPPKARKPNPYRLPSLPTFLAAFAPLHAAGWRLDAVPVTASDTGGAAGTTSHAADRDLLSGADLQGRRLVRAYAFPMSRAGWRGLTTLLTQVGEAVETEDHHPCITVSPFADLPAAMRDSVVDPSTAGYVLHIATLTHTPLPPLAEKDVFEGKPLPGVTTKDLRLAVRIEGLYDGLSMDAEA